MTVTVLQPSNMTLPHRTLLPADLEGLDAIPLLARGAPTNPLNVLGTAYLTHVHLNRTESRGSGRSRRRIL